MAAKIGILGESTAVTKDVTVTIYTVPSSKAARGKIQLMAENGTAAPIKIRVGSPGTENTINFLAQANLDFFTGRMENATPDPANSANSLPGYMSKTAILADMDGDSGLDQRYIVEPLPEGYFLSTGGTVTFRIGDNDLLDLLIQFVGVEDDA